MYKMLLIAGSLCVMLPLTLAIMGSPPKNLPPCLHGGSQTILQERYRCSCVDSRMDRQCKLTLVSIESTPVEMSYGPITVQISSASTFHIGLMFITNDAVGDGSLLTIRGSDKAVQLKLFLKRGRPGMNLTLGGSSVSMQFSQNPVMNDNAWHYLDIFMEAESGDLVGVYLMGDWCRYANIGDCVMKQSISITSTFSFGGTVQLGSDVSASTGIFNGCIDKLIISGSYLDFYDATWGQKFSQGCQRSEQGCQKDSKPFCGTHGVCLNALRNTDMLTCRCEAGYQPDTRTEVYPHRWPCNVASSAWSTTGTEYNAQFLDIVPGRFRISVRTRTKTFVLFAVTAWKLYLTVTNSVPQLELGQSKLQLSKVNVSDGNWHLFDVIMTQNIAKLQIDELDQDFQAVVRLPNVTLKTGPVEIVIAKDATGTCLDDVWVDFADKWPNFEKDYPLMVISNPQYTRHVSWATTGRQQSCDSWTDPCAAQRPCDPTAMCINEWRGFRCECPSGKKMDSTGKCVSEFCDPNPCVNGICSTVNVPAGENFTCICNEGWTGKLCTEEKISTAELSWWWILLIILIILVIIIIIIIAVCCVKKRAKKRAETEKQKAVLDGDPFGLDSQLNDPWDSGEKDFVGPIDYTVLQPNQHRMSPPNDMADGQIRRDYVPRDHGQKTSDRPPWEQLEGRENPGMNLDQVLEYGYEGYDGKPPPGFSPVEPPTFIGAEDEDSNEDDIQTRVGYEPPSLSRMSNSR
ncbi:Neural-cadherin [Fasciola hepatica]|uniref:Neural-cadherin n=1 Tax=Fasciola hepatica TaxID=6192 RepID=A0A4E0S450_FASHE|nr:Neural-cadherin [Fasciola hepatica]